jgi:hypothetical protein
MMRKILIATASLVMIATAAELLARYWLGLGTPPLSVAHPKIEYLMAPNQDVMRFGNRVLVNEYGMRNEPLHTKLPEEFRVMALGDSVLNGGSLTDHRRLATTILSQKGLVVLNVSAGSWGPRNELEYVREYGFFRSDLLIVVLSNHDAGDEPTYAPLDPTTHPTERPFSALYEAAVRYLPRYLPNIGTLKPERPADRPADPAESAKALDKLIGIAAQSDIKTCVILHREKSELLNHSPSPGLDLFRSIAQREGVQVIEGSSFVTSSGYRDNIHLDDVGQTQLAQALLKCIAGARHE